MNLSNKIKDLTIIRPDDWHLHLRDGDILIDVVKHSAKQFARAIVMPNLDPPITTTEMAINYKERILLNIPKKIKFSPLMTLFLTEKTSIEEIKKALNSKIIYGIKYYPKNTTTNSGDGVNDIFKCSEVLEEMEKYNIPLLLHGEVYDESIDFYDRENEFIEKVLYRLRKNFPSLKIVFEHISTENAVNFVLNDNGPTAATITAHHLLRNRNSIFENGINPHYFCLPILKSEKHRKALLKAATSGNPKFFLGTDSAPHLIGAKENSCGCAGCYTAFHAMELYATAFESVNALDKLEGFSSFYGPDFYGLPRNNDTITLKRKKWIIPEILKISHSKIVPFDSKKTLNWFVDEEN